MKRKHEESPRLAELYEFIGRLQPDMTILDPPSVVPLRGIRLMASCDHVLDLFESCYAWDATIARVKRSIAQYWPRIYSIQLLADYATPIEGDSVTTVGGRQGRPKKLITDGWSLDRYRFLMPNHRHVATHRYLMTEFLALNRDYTPADLINAVFKERVDLVKSIVDSGVDVNSRALETMSPLFAAANSLSLPIISYLLSHPDIDADDIDNDGNSFMQRTGGFLSFTAIQAIAPKVDLHIQNKKGQNIIHMIMGDQRTLWSSRGLGVILQAGSDTLTLCVDGDGKIPRLAEDADNFNDATEMAVMVYASQCRAFRVVSAMLLPCIGVPPLAGIVMGYYTDQTHFSGE